MSKVRVTVSLERELVEALDEQVERGRDDSRSAAMERALRAWRRTEADDAFSRQLELLDPAEERAIAEEFMGDYAALALPEAS